MLPIPTAPEAPRVLTREGRKSTRSLGRFGVRSCAMLPTMSAPFELRVDAHGYVAKVAQSAASLRGIEISFIWLPAFGFALAIIPVLFYKKYELLEPQIHVELERRRTAAD